MCTSKKDSNIKRIAVVSFGDPRQKLIEWAYANRNILQKHELIATAPIAELLTGSLGMDITTLMNGRVGGYRQLAQMITEDNIDVIIFFGDSRTAHSMDIGINDLLPLAAERNVIIASNAGTTDMVMKALRESKENPLYYIEESPHRMVNVIKNYLIKPLLRAV